MFLILTPPLFDVVNRSLIQGIGLRLCDLLRPTHTFPEAVATGNVVLKSFHKKAGPCQ